MVSPTDAADDPVVTGPVTRAVLDIARDVRDEHELAARICAACIAGLDVDGAAISLLTTTPARVTLWASDATADLLEEMQFSMNEGACIEAGSSGRPVLVPDLADSTETARWPVFASAVLEQTDVRALFVLPLQWGVVNLGVLDLYRTAPGPLAAAQLRDVLSAADAAALMYITMRTDPEADAWLDQSASSRAVVHQATGMVLVQLGVPAQEALARMRGRAFAEQRLLVDMARDIVARRVTFAEDIP